jgi:hypothetical protein
MRIVKFIMYYKKGGFLTYDIYTSYNSLSPIKLLIYIPTFLIIIDVLLFQKLEESHGTFFFN